MKRALPLLFCLGLFIQPSNACADEPEPLHRFEDKSPPPPGSRSKLLLLGTAVTAGFYLPALGSSYLWSEHRGVQDMRIPVVGPWMAVGRTSLCSADHRDPTLTCSDFMQVAGAILLVLDGLGQAGGVALMLESLFLPTSSTSKELSALTPQTAPWSSIASGAHISRKKHFMGFQSGDFEVRPVPMVRGNSDLGFAFIGSF